MKRQNNTSQKVFKVIGNVIYVTFIVTLLFTLFANLTKKENQISGIFGFAFAVVQTGSMVDGGFNVGDMVVIKNVNTDNLKKGDIIVFYYTGGSGFTDPEDVNHGVFQEGGLTDITTDLETGTYTKTKTSCPYARLTKTDAMNSGAMLVFHRITSVWADEFGTRFFETKGDSNGTVDGKVREDFVCAQYVNTGRAVQGFLSFVAKPYGMAVVVIIPIILTVILQIFAVNVEVKGNVVTSRLIERKIKYREVDTSKIKIAEFLTEPEKVYLYDITPNEDKPDLAIVLWDENVEEILKVYDNRDEFYNKFAEKFGNSDKKKLEFLKIKAEVVHNNPQISEANATKQVKEILKQTNKGEKKCC